MTDLKNITLAKGQHAGDCDDPERCLFEWYNFLARAEHTDRCPPGVSPVLHVFGMRLNDALPDDRRQELRRYLPNGTSPLAGTAADGKDTARAWIAADWVIRTVVPAWLELAGLDSDAEKLRQLPRVDGAEVARGARVTIRAAKDNAYAARTEAWKKIRAYADADAAAYAAAYAAAAAAADAYAAAYAYADADAAAYAAAYAAAAAAAAADAYAAAAAYADADAAAYAAAYADAAAAAAADRRLMYDQVYKASREAAAARLAPVAAVVQDSAIALYDVLITGEWPAAGLTPATL